MNLYCYKCGGRHRAKSKQWAAVGTDSRGKVVGYKCVKCVKKK